MPVMSLTNQEASGFGNYTPWYTYGIYDPVTGEPVLDYDSFVNCHIEGKMVVSDFPVEQGGFATYNKVNKPMTLKVRIAVAEGGDRRHKLLLALDKLMKSTQLMNVVAKDATYLNQTLEDYSYLRDVKNGTGILIDLKFTEVRQITPAYTNAKIPGGRSSKNSGVVSPINPAVASTLNVEPMTDAAAQKQIDQNTKNLHGSQTGVAAVAPGTKKSVPTTVTPAQAFPNPARNPATTPCVS